MKTLLIASGALLVVAANAQTEQTNDEWETKTGPRTSESLVLAKPVTINAVVDDDITYSGIAVAVVNAENKLQLLNPFAPEEYGAAEDSVVRDPITGNVSGLKIFSIGF